MKSRQETIIEVDYKNLDDLRSSIDGRFHYFYKIVNNINQKYYYGIHTTDDIFDGYSGSGILLKQVYKKYGRENCTKYILGFFEDRKSLLDYEKYIVNYEVLENTDCYNIILGGGGTYECMTPVVTLDGKNIIISKEEYKNNKHLYKHPTSEKIHINNGVKNKMVREKDLYKYLSNGWERGQLQKSNLNKILINKQNKEERFIYESELEEYLSNGWERGGKSRNKGQTSFAKSLIWINNGTNQKRINESELEEYLSNGWVKGTCQNNTKGYIRITNGQETRNINPSNKEELKYYLSNGWKKGSHSETNKGSVWINNGSETIQIQKNNLEEYLSNGWKKGRLNMVGFTPNINKIAVNKNRPPMSMHGRFFAAEVMREAAAATAES